MNDGQRKLHENLFQLANRLIFLERQPFLLKNGARLFHSEVHLLLIVGQEQRMKVSAIVGRVGVTKGAISQTLSRLEKKDLICKRKEESNRRETWIRLTQKGKMVFTEIDNRRNRIHDGVAREFRALSSSERDFLNSFVENMKQFVDRYLP